MRLFVALAAITLGLSACTPSAVDTDVTASPSISSTPKPALSPSPTKTVKTPTAKPSRTLINWKSRITSDPDNVFLRIDEQVVCVGSYTVKVDGFTANGNTTITIKSDNGFTRVEQGFTENDGTAFTAIECTGYPAGNYTLHMTDEVSNRWAEVKFTSAG